MAAPSKTVTDVEGRRLTLTNLDKVLYPEAGFTKAMVIDYYARAAPVLLPHLRGRALTMVRWPDGVEAESFFEKRCPPHAPRWLRRAEVDGIVAPVIDDAPSLVWVANLAALELHTHQATVDDPDHPVAVVFDLDPGPPAGLLECARVALELAGHLERHGLLAVVKTSGRKGLHVAAAVAGATADEAKAFALALGRVLADRSPDTVTTTMAKTGRAGRVFVDWSQNDRHKTTVCAYSLRAESRPVVSTPLSWDEVSDALDGATPQALVFEAGVVLERLARHGDLFAPALGPGHRLPSPPSPPTPPSPSPPTPPSPA